VEEVVCSVADCLLRRSLLVCLCGRLVVGEEVVCSVADSSVVGLVEEEVVCCGRL
jgi:hypothetical protein